MFMTISSVLSQDDCADIRSRLNGALWKDGAQTAGPTAQAVKHNQQADLSTRLGAKIQSEIFAKITAHPVLSAAAQPAKFSKLLISKTTVGGGYGLHFDNAFMGSGSARVRTDLSFTLCLNAPEDYEGGELTVEQSGMSHSFKPAAGSLVLYPSHYLHAVQPVRSGSRIVCVGWIESLVQSSEHREILFDLINVQTELARQNDANAPTALTLGNSIARLKRLFS